MSCGKLHEAGEAFHFHAPGEEHAHDTEVIDSETVDEAEAAPKEPGRIRTALSGAWAQHGHVIKPFSLLPAMDGSAWFVHQVLGANPLHALIGAAVAGAAGEITSEVGNGRRGEVHPVRVKARQAAVAATALMAVEGPLGVAGPYGIGQWAVLALGLTMAGRVAYEKHKAHGHKLPEPELPVLLATPATAPVEPDPRMTAFTTEFCHPDGPLAGVTAGRFREVPNGFLFELDFTSTRHAVGDVETLTVPIAKLYGVRKDSVSVGYIPEPDRDNENFCQVIVAKRAMVSAEERAKPVLNHWDGKSTWNPETGTFDLGYFKDMTVTHYEEHRPRSGAMMGLLCGVPGSGKTGTEHVLACEAGLASLCGKCGRAGTVYSPGQCDRCDMHRVMAVWVGDVQEQPMSLWRGRADLCGWGPEGCVELLEFADQAYQKRGPQMSEMEWWDKDPSGRRRHNVGKGWFDVEIGFPLIDITIDEWPLLVTHPDTELRNTAKALILRAVTLWRKRGLHFKLSSQTTDLSLIGVRELREIMKFFSVVAHRLDESSSSSLGIAGKPMLLPPDIPGAGFTGHYDRRSDDEFATKYAPETAKPGDGSLTDIRHIAGIIGQTPIRYDAAVTSLMDEWKLQHQTVFEEWTGRPVEEEAPRPHADLSAVPPPTSTVPAFGGMAYREDADAVRKCLLSRPGPWGFQDLMKETGLSLGAVNAALGALESNGQAVPAGEKQYKSA